jgi:hypothetical protein
MAIVLSDAMPGLASLVPHSRGAQSAAGSLLYESQAGTLERIEMMRGPGWIDHDWFVV